jgi:hypothetical protein
LDHPLVKDVFKHSLSLSRRTGDPSELELCLTDYAEGTTIDNKKAFKRKPVNGQYLVESMTATKWNHLGLSEPDMVMMKGLHKDQKRQPKNNNFAEKYPGGTYEMFYTIPEVRNIYDDLVREEERLKNHARDVKATPINENKRLAEETPSTSYYQPANALTAQLVKDNVSAGHGRYGSPHGGVSIGASEGQIPRRVAPRAPRVSLTFDEPMDQESQVINPVVRDPAGANAPIVDTPTTTNVLSTPIVTSEEVTEETAVYDVASDDSPNEDSIPDDCEFKMTDEQMQDVIFKLSGGKWRTIPTDQQLIDDERTPVRADEDRSTHLSEYSA